MTRTSMTSEDGGKTVSDTGASPILVRVAPMVLKLKAVGLTLSKLIQRHPKRKNVKVDGSNSMTMESGEFAMSSKKRKLDASASVSMVKEAWSSPIVEDELLAMENKLRVATREGGEGLDMSVKLELCRVSDPYGLTGKVQSINLVWGVEGFDPFVLGGITSHHIAAGTLGILAGLFHLSIRPPQRLYKGLRLGNIETVISSSIDAVFYVAFVVAGTMWYGSTTTPINFFGPTHYQWDQGYFQQEVYQRVSAGLAKNQCLSESWSKIPEKLVFYDYIGNNPAKGGLFRAGLMDNGDGIAVRWLGHPAFRDRGGA
ncbi:hypothetical protein GIB67_018713 [Kingdonia uniflora]|uniref:Uncharacterized protein n=1 Tax=Kingdonia uniflora TaxID=39325 RepID=A0A7J7L242_9MAGN|nr:hypothetical protein GIB67_018713 [Kingdonia uniflora]